MSNEIVHILGSSVQDLVTDGGFVFDGLSLQCGDCKKFSMIRAPRAEFTKIDEIGNIYCPYCGLHAECRISNSWGGRITDNRPRFTDD